MNREIHSSARPIFIVGSPRSGSTILAWSLAQHSDLWTSSESHFLWRLFGASDHLANVYKTVNEWPGGSWLHDEGISRDDFVKSLGIGVDALFASRSGGKRWIDQTPYYVYMADQLAAMFPNARFLHVLRDGRRVVNSMTHFASALSPGVWTRLVQSGRLQGWATDFREACREWQRSVRAGLRFLDRRRDICLTVTNESLVAGAEEAFSEIFRFLDVGDEPGPAAYFQSNRINSSFPADLAPHARNGSNLDPWCGWDDERKEIFTEEAGDVLLQCGMATEEELNLSDYHRVLFHIRQVASALLPPSSLSLIISEGDEGLLNLGGRQPWHFPRTVEGWNAGHPVDSEEAIAHLEELRRKGAQYLLFPTTSLWWLDFYTGFRDHLASRYPVIWTDEACLIYQLSKAAAPTQDVGKGTSG